MGGQRGAWWAGAMGTREGVLGRTSKQLQAWHGERKRGPGRSESANGNEDRNLDGNEGADEQLAAQCSAGQWVRWVAAAGEAVATKGREGVNIP